MAELAKFPQRRLQPFKVETPVKWQGVEPPRTRWVVDGAIPRRAVCLFSGPGSSGKSYLDLQLQVACATYRPWLGIYVKPAKTFAIYGEDPEEVIHQRVHAICRHYDVEMGDLDDMQFMARRDDGTDFSLFDVDRFQTSWKSTPLWQSLCDHVISGGIEIVFLDTAARVFNGNGNVQAHVAAFMRQLEWLAVRIDGAVILNIHPSKAEASTYSGNTQWEALARAHLHLKRPKGYDPEDKDADHASRTLRNVKANWGPIGQALQLQWRDGVFVNINALPAQANYRDDER